MRADRPHDEFRGQALPYPWTVETGADGELAAVTHDGGWHRVVITYDDDSDSYTVSLEVDGDHPHVAALDEPLHQRVSVDERHLGVVVAATTMFADYADPFTNPHSRGYTDHVETTAD